MGRAVVGERDSGAGRRKGLAVEFELRDAAADAARILDLDLVTRRMPIRLPQLVAVVDTRGGDSGS